MRACHSFQSQAFRLKHLNPHPVGNQRPVVEDNDPSVSAFSKPGGRTARRQEFKVCYTSAPITGGRTATADVQGAYPLAKDDDIEHFLATFERVAVTCRWPEATWAIRLVPLLTGKACSAFVAMDMSVTDDNRRVKEAILKKYNIKADTYRMRFRSAVIMPGETPKDLYVCLKELFTKWIRPEKHSFEEICEMIILEQFMDMMSTDMAVWIWEHDPKTAEAAARLAELFQTVRQGTRGFSTSR
ncbi:hypothetical protein ACEWY4_021557 [Coilia grayii]|uniref:SCAN box domain-containing protein n=1 Tax=Coilia grayii TaxID=363190 RepID=A0ABD1JAL0_9TELE